MPPPLSVLAGNLIDWDWIDAFNGDLFADFTPRPAGDVLIRVLGVKGAGGTIVMPDDAQWTELADWSDAYGRYWIQARVSTGVEGSYGEPTFASDFWHTTTGWVRPRSPGLTGFQAPTYTITAETDPFTTPTLVATQPHSARLEAVTGGLAPSSEPFTVLDPGDWARIGGLPNAATGPSSLAIRVKFDTTDSVSPGEQWTNPGGGPQSSASLLFDLPTSGWEINCTPLG